ncbi:hypothetical protein SAMN05216483_6691 [Streptomyces sp. 2131.1]|uniref:hypothetical protein n=1 Tax=Streptomyces sp. 2131.1 TaxID=1855346 RepID=UPI00089C8AAA|nr:hypothetical protein [Streptomyces sp. 2131.1]SEE83025.1 hypothetical protein SAMN05216483_6691 [Streptomyces sp. 2131.1]
MADTQTTGIKNADELITLAAAFGLTVTVERTDRDTLTSYVVRFAIPVPAANAGTELGRAIAGDTITLLWTKAKKKGARGRLADATVWTVAGHRKARTLRAVTAAVDTLGRSSNKYARDAAPFPEDVVDAPHAVFVDGHQVHAGIPAAHVRTIVKNRRFRGWTFHQDADKAIVCETRRYVPVQPAAAEEAPAPVADERQHVRITNDGPAEVIPTREALDEINAAMMEPEVKRTVKRMSASKSTAHIVYRDGRTVYLRPATPGDVFPTPAERPTDAELTGDIDAGHAAYLAETFAAVADGTALPVRADMIRPGMDVIHAHMGETRTIDTVTAYVGAPGAPWVRPSWTFRSHDESTAGSTYPPEMHLMVTRASLDAVFGPAPVEDAAPAAPVDEKTRRWAEGFAAKWWAEQNTGEPTDAALAAVFAHTVKPPKPEAYPLIREAITALTPPPAAAPLFAAHAAREAAEEATDLTPRALSTLAHHLETLPLAAPPALHERLHAARDTAEGAWEALRFAHSLAAKTAARSAAKDAIVRARAAILAVQPHARRMHGTDMPHTADSIRAAALAYMHLGATPDETNALKNGAAEVRIDCRPDTGNGWTVTARITAGIRDVRWFLPAHPPIVVKFRRVDGRQSPADNARKVIGSMLRVDVPVTYKDAAHH